MRSARRHSADTGGSDEHADSGRRLLSTVGAFRRGLVGDVLNPKVGLFYTTVFPQFVRADDPLLPTAVLLLAVHAVILLLWYPTVSTVVLRAGRLIGPRAKTLLERAMGAVLIGLGVRLAVARQ
jgi:threonine/homoserine/homoserine lactone efflux protein